MASLPPTTTTTTSSNLRSPFIGIRIPPPHNHHHHNVGFARRKVVECKESRIGKQPITVPSNVTLIMDGQDLKVKGPLGELAITYPREVLLEREDSGILTVKRATDTRRANQMHGLFRKKMMEIIIAGKVSLVREMRFYYKKIRENINKETKGKSSLNGAR